MEKGPKLSSPPQPPHWYRKGTLVRNATPNTSRTTYTCPPVLVDDASKEKFEDIRDLKHHALDEQDEYRVQYMYKRRREYLIIYKLFERNINYALIYIIIPCI